MLDILKYPFDPQQILSMRKRIRRELLGRAEKRIEKRVAVLGGSTTHDIVEIIELFLLNHGIEPLFYESEYAQYWQDAMFIKPELKEFKPDVLYIHTSNRNIVCYPSLTQSTEEVNELLDSEYHRFMQIWEQLKKEINCPIIQNNFEYPFYRLMGNRDASDIRGKVNYITRLNLKFYEYAQKHGNFFINDINYLSADYGLDKWSDPFYWYMYKYALALPAVPYLAHSVANIIKSLFGKNKKAFALDLDDTLWGGSIGDDGAENILIGQETPTGQAFSEFQAYLKEHKQLGVILNVISKNDYKNAISGLSRPDSTLVPDDFVIIKANWERKSCNLSDIADELTLSPDSFVFVDDNLAEREIVRQELPGVAIPEIDRCENYIFLIDRAGFFEASYISEDDFKRNDMYKRNTERSMSQAIFADYREYLLSLEMRAEIKPFEPLYMSRIAQLTNKSNQFNLTTKRFQQAEIEAAATDPGKITLYGRLIDKFGDNGVVTVVIGRIEKQILHIELWLMSCRVLKREMESAMLDELVCKAKALGINRILGYYYPTAKNTMVRDFYGQIGFEKISEEDQCSSIWAMAVEEYEKRCNVILVNGGLASYG